MLLTLMVASLKCSEEEEEMEEEMFTGVSAQFLAVLETLANHKGRALTRCPPRPVTDLDEDTITDVFEELLCAGSDLVLSALNQTEGLECSTPLMQLAMQGTVYHKLTQINNLLIKSD